MDELTQLIQLCRRLGAETDEQAAVMARQLLKRTDQVADERGITRAAALEHLLSLVIHGRQGNVPPGFTSPSAK